MSLFTLNNLENDVLLVAKQKEFPVIASQSDFAGAGDYLLVLKKKRKALEEFRLELTSPLTAQVKAIKKRFDDAGLPIDQKIEELEEKMKLFWEAEKVRVDAEQARLDAEAIKNAPTEGTLVEIVNDIKTSHGEIATTTVRTVTRWRLLDINAVPTKFLAVDEKALNAHVKDGGACPSGIEYFEETILSSR